MSLDTRAVARIIAILLVTAGCFPDSTAPARVVREVASVTITPLQSGSFALGSSIILQADARDSAGASMYASLSWLSSDPSIVVLNRSQQPYARGVSAYAVGVGITTITVSSGSKSASVSVVVRAPGPVATIALTVPRSVALGTTLQITVAQRDSDGVALRSTMPTFLSSDSTVLRVSATGLVTALAEGSATVSATNNEKIGSATISVTAGARAFVWTALAGMIDLGVLPGFAVSKATARRLCRDLPH